MFSDKMPKVPFKLSDGHMNELFRNFTFNWVHIGPILWLLFGTLFGLYVLKLLRDHFVD